MLTTVSTQECYTPSHKTQTRVENNFDNFLFFLKPCLTANKLQDQKYTIRFINPKFDWNCSHNPWKQTRNNAYQKSNCYQIYAVSIFTL